jgi:hypothetical protein
MSWPRWRCKAKTRLTTDKERGMGVNTLTTKVDMEGRGWKG